MREKAESLFGVIPAKAGIQDHLCAFRNTWTPVFTGVTACISFIIDVGLKETGKRHLWRQEWILPLRQRAAGHSKGGQGIRLGANFSLKKPKEFDRTRPLI